MDLTMPKSRLKLPPMELGDETIHERIARLRKQHGCTQIELAKRIGLTQALISNYEQGVLRLHSEMVARFAHALNVTTDELIGFKAKNRRKNGKPEFRLKLVRRMQKIDALPPSQQKVLLQTIDNFLRGAVRE